MKTINGIKVYERNDVIQIVRGPDWGVLGVVMEAMGSELSCWGRTPGNEGNRHYRFNVGSGEVMLIGKVKIRPPLPGEPIMTAPPSQPQETPPERGQAPISTPAAETIQPPHRTEESTPQPVAPSGSARADAGAEGHLLPGTVRPQFGGASAEDAMPKPPKTLEPIKPELLQPAVFHRQSAFEAHHINPPPAPVAQPRTESEPPRETPKAPSLPPQGTVRRTPTKKRVQDLQVLLEGAEAGAEGRPDTNAAPSANLQDGQHPER